ncbi:MAG: HD domain-containing phosphohydrolase, partial [Fimbriimonadaceae bacterium]
MGELALLFSIGVVIWQGTSAYFKTAESIDRQLRLASSINALEKSIQSVSDSELSAAQKSFAIATTHEMIHERHEELGELISGTREAHLLNMSALGVSVLLAFSSLVLIRYASNQERKTKVALEENVRQQQAYREIVTSLPIGLLSIERDGSIIANDRWSKDLGNGDADNAHDTLHQALNKEFRHDLVEMFAEPQKERPQAIRSFRKQLTTNSKFGKDKFVDVLISPLECGRLLGVSLDVSATTKARKQVERRSNELKAKNALLSRALNELEGNLESMAKMLVRAVDHKDSYTGGHSDRVMQYSLMIANELDLGEYERRILSLGTLIHDVGKIGIPDRVLRKPGRLTDEEAELIRQHPVFGANMIQDIGLFQECLPIVRSHHERLDGTGYPDGLRGAEIPLLVRICTVA